MSALEAVGRWAAFTLASILAAVPAILRPALWLRPFYAAFVGGLPLAAVAGVALGAVVWVHTRGVLDRAGPGMADYLPTVLAAAVLLELAPIGAGLILAARTGASLAAELSAMRVSEQLDALSLLGVHPLRRLVGPRVLACVLAGPLLHVAIVALALSSGYLAEAVAGTTSWPKYRAAVLQELRLIDVLPAAMKTLVFGALVGATGCYAGLRAGEGSEGVGRAATAGVVASVLLVLVADVFLVGLIRVVVG